VFHRHLNHQGFTPAAIDDIIDRGNPEDWAELREAADNAIMERILSVSASHADDPSPVSCISYGAIMLSSD
jgi:hypothetical protein